MEIVRKHDFPWGLVCIRCNQEILPGQLFYALPDSVTSDGCLIEELVCVPCLQ